MKEKWKNSNILTVFLIELKLKQVFLLIERDNGFEYNSL